MHKENQEIKAYADLKKVRMWEVAEAIGCNDNTLSRRLRKPLTSEEKEILCRKIDEIAGVKFNV